MPINLFINGSDIREMNLGNHQQNQNIEGQNYYGENDDINIWIKAMGKIIKLYLNKSIYSLF